MSYFSVWRLAECHTFSYFSGWRWSECHTFFILFAPQTLYSQKTPADPRAQHIVHTLDGAPHQYHRVAHLLSPRDDIRDGIRPRLVELRITGECNLPRTPPRERATHTPDSRPSFFVEWVALYPSGVEVRPHILVRPVDNGVQHTHTPHLALLEEATRGGVVRSEEPSGGSRLLPLRVAR